MPAVFELHGPKDVDGFQAWHVTLESEGHPKRTYGFDEREGCHTPAQAVQMAFAEHRDADRAEDGARILVTVEEARVVVSTPISDN